MSHDHAETIRECHACAEACEHCAQACLAEPGVANMAQCIRLDLDCAALCRLAALLMTRDSRFAKELCRVCAVACDACAAECLRHDAEHCRACARACRRCAEACRRMASEAQRIESIARAHV
jgi:hypothetical protein